MLGDYDSHQPWNKDSGNELTSTPVKISMEPKNHPIEKENHLPNLHDFGVPCLLVMGFEGFSAEWSYNYPTYSW